MTKCRFRDVKIGQKFLYGYCTYVKLTENSCEVAGLRSVALAFNPDALVHAIDEPASEAPKPEREFSRAVDLLRAYQAQYLRYEESRVLISRESEKQNAAIKEMGRLLPSIIPILESHPEGIDLGSQVVYCRDGRTEFLPAPVDGYLINWPEAKPEATS